MRYRTKRLFMAILPVVVLSVALVLGLSSAFAFADDAEESAVPSSPGEVTEFETATEHGVADASDTAEEQAPSDTLDLRDAPDIPAAYPVWLNNGKASYDPDSKTLTLKNITLNGASSGGEDYTRAIVNSEDQDLNLVCTDVSLINTNNSCPAIEVEHGNLTISGTLTA